MISRRSVMLQCATLSLSLAAPALAAATEVKSLANGVPYLLGGVTEGELADIEATRSKFNLAIYTRSTLSGAAVCDARVTIFDTTTGKLILELPMDGPWLLSTLPEGRYKITATFQNERQERSIEIAAFGQRELQLGFRSDPQVSLYPAPQ